MKTLFPDALSRSPLCFRPGPDNVPGPPPTPPAYAQLRASESGRPALFEVMRDAALMAGHEFCAARCDVKKELWHRAPEEWELERVRPTWGVLTTNLSAAQELGEAIGEVSIRAVAVNVEGIERPLEGWTDMRDESQFSSAVVARNPFPTRQRLDGRRKR